MIAVSMISTGRAVPPDAGRMAVLCDEDKDKDNMD